MRRELQKQKECNGVNWPTKGWKIHTGLPVALAISLTVTIMMNLTAGCNGVSSNQFLPSTSVSSTPELLTNPITIQTTEDVKAPEGLVLSSDPALCHIAVAGNPLDVSIPDGTILEPGEEFIKIWRIRNAGTCEWTNNYTIEWFSGDALGISNHVEIIHSVLPDETVEIAVDMMAPLQEGVFQSNWKICDPAMVCFGLGPNGAYPFWARIQVREISTVTPSIIPYMTATAFIFLTGKTELSPGEGFDLDKGVADLAEEADIQFMVTEAGLVLNALNQAKLSLFGAGNPQEKECLNLLETADSSAIGIVEPSSAVCFLSTQGLPGVIKVNRINLESQKIEIEYITWYAP
jgi:hypothetical protein